MTNPSSSSILYFMGSVFLSKYTVFQGNHDLLNPRLSKGLLEMSCQYDIVSFSKPTVHGRSLPFSRQIYPSKESQALKADEKHIALQV